MKASDMRKFLFPTMKGCSNHNCIVTGPKKGMGTNSMCKCIENANQIQLVILQQRLAHLINENEDKETK